MTGSRRSARAGQDLPAANIIVTLRSLTPDLVPSKRRVAQVITSAPDRVAHMTIGELGDAAHTSPTTVMRLCHDIGLDSFRELRVALATAAGRAAERADGDTVGSDIAPSDSLTEVIRTITHADALAVEETGTLLSVKTVGAAVDALAEARRVDVFGVGASAFVAMDLQQKLHRIGLICFVWPDQHAALTATALLRPGDVAIGISHTGNTKDTVDIIRRAAHSGATTVGITAAPRSHLAATVDLPLITASRETTFRAGAMASRIAALTAVDVLFVAIAQRRYEQTLEALDATRRVVAHRRFGQPGDRS